MPLTRISRRDALKITATSFALAAATGVSTKKAIAGLASPSIRVRRNINDPTFGPDVAAAYRKAVGMMKDKADADPKSFAAQHSIHTNFCPHGNWYFLPWHRAYLAAFEAICADVLDDPSFALPYWDWTEDRILPPAVAEPTFGGQTNWLFDDKRFMQSTTTLSESLARFDIDAERILWSDQYQNHPGLQDLSNLRQSDAEGTERHYQEMAARAGSEVGAGARAARSLSRRG